MAHEISCTSLRAMRCALLVGTAGIACPSLAQTPPPSQSPQSAVQEIVVTAQKREQNLQNVPISITALGQDAIKANRIQDVRDLNAIAPNLTVREGSGGANYPQYTLRGIYTGGATLGLERGVSLYLDGVYLENVAGSVFELADVERIEVLKGPQGTLFGRNATGGAISIITKEPTGIFGGHQDFSVGTLGTFRSKTHVDLPKIGPISASFTYLHSQNRGDTRNLGAGTTWDFGPATGGKLGTITSPRYLGSHDTNAVQAAVKFDFHPDLDLIYRFDYSKDKFTPTADGLSYLAGIPGSGGPVPTTLLGEIYAANVAAGNPVTPVSLTRPKAVNNWFSLPGYTKNIGHNLTARWKATDQISFKNILAYRKSVLFSPGNQLDGAGGFYNLPVDLGPVGAPGVVLPPGGLLSPQGETSFNPTAPFTYLSDSAGDRQHQISDEFQLNITTNWFNITAGYLYFHSHEVYGPYAGLFNSHPLAAMVGANTSAAGTNFVVSGSPGGQPSNITIDSNAWFVQPEFHLTDRLDLIGGARITVDRKSGTEFVPFPAALAGTGIPISSPIRYHDTEATYLAGLNYKLADHILAYGKFSTGYISGGKLATVTFEPERAKSWEAGLKTELFDRRFRSNLSVFDVKYRNIQLTTSGTLANIPSAALYGVVVLAAADAKAYGFEWENTLVPFRGLTLTANAGYTHFHFIQNTVQPGLADASGPPGYLTYERPRWTGNLAAQYDTPEIWRGGHAMFQINGNFTSRNLLSNDTALGNGDTAIIDPALRKAETAPAHWIVNGRVGLTGIDIGPTKLEIALWGKNIFDEKEVIQISPYDFTPSNAPGFVPIGLAGSVLYERQRTFGLDVSVNF
jgi:iron complex outermembrane receptor protein